MKKLSMIAALDDNYGVGIDNKLPWHIPEDLSYFKKITMGKNIIMGRKTFESLPGILPNRKHIVLTKNKNFVSNDENVLIIYSFEDCMKFINSDEKESIIIGGSNIWEVFYNEIELFYITHVFGSFDVDTYFPSCIDLNKMKILSKEKSVLCEYVVYQK